MSHLSGQERGRRIPFAVRGYGVRVCGGGDVRTPAEWGPIRLNDGTVVFGKVEVRDGRVYVVGEQKLLNYVQVWCGLQGIPCTATPQMVAVGGYPRPYFPIPPWPFHFEIR